LSSVTRLYRKDCVQIHQFGAVRVVADRGLLDHRPSFGQLFDRRE
jgi:hypothetical protein